MYLYKPEEFQLIRFRKRKVHYRVPQPDNGLHMQCCLLSSSTTPTLAFGVWGCGADG
jgi:hypothetical protein